MSTTRLVSGSQLTPYQFTQQSVPTQELKRPKWESVRPVLKALRAAKSAGEQEFTLEIMAQNIVTEIKNNLVFIFMVESRERRERESFSVFVH